MQSLSSTTLLLPLLLALGASAPPQDATPPELALTLGLDEVAVLVAAAEVEARAPSPLRDWLGGELEAESSTALAEAGLLEEGGVTERGRALAAALGAPDLAVQVRRTRLGSLRARWLLAAGDSAWFVQLLGEMSVAVEGPYASASVADLLTSAIQLPDDAPSATLEATLGRIEWLVLQTLAREREAFAALEGEVAAPLGLTAEEISRAMLRPERVEALLDDPQFDLLERWEELDDPARIAPVLDRLVARGLLVQARSDHGPRHGFSETGELLAASALQPPVLIEFLALRPGGSHALLQLGCSPSGVLLVRPRSQPRRFEVEVLPSPEALGAQLTALLESAAPSAADEGVPTPVAGAQPAPTAPTQVGDALRAELERGAFRLHAAQSTTSLWDRGRPDTWSVDSDGDGTIDVEYEDTDGDDEPDFVRVADLPGRPFTRSFVLTEEGWQESNILEAFLEVDFRLPWARKTYHRHDVDVLLNDRVIATLTDALPEGRHRFRIRPQHLNVSIEMATENRVRIESEHLRGGHYVVSTDYRLVLHMSEVSRYVIAQNPADAQRILTERSNLVTAGIDIALYANEWRLDPPAPEQGQAARLIGRVHNDGEETAQGWTLRFTDEGAPEAPPFAEVALEDLPKGRSIVIEAEWTAVAGDRRLAVSALPPEGGVDLRSDNDRVEVAVRAGGDAEAPNLRITEPAADGAVTSTLTLEGTASDDVALARIEVSIDGGRWLAIERSERWQHALELPPGEHAIRVRASDTSGKETTVTRRVEVAQ